MTQKEFTELTNLPEEQYETANAAYMACDLDKKEWAKNYLEIKDNVLYKATVDEAILRDKQQRLANEIVNEFETKIKFLENSLKVANEMSEEQDKKIYELAEFIAEQAEEKHSRTLAIKARELMGEKEYLIYKLERGYFLSKMDMKKIATLVAYAAEEIKEREAVLNDEPTNDQEA